MTHSELYECDGCSYTEWSNTGNPFKGFDRLTYTLMLCADCLKQYTEEREDELKAALQVEEDGEGISNGQYIKNGFSLVDNG